MRRNSKRDSVMKTMFKLAALAGFAALAAPSLVRNEVARLAIATVIAAVTAGHSTLPSQP